MLESLPFGSVRPLGWMHAQIAGDLAHGFAGTLDALTPRAASDLFANRIDDESWWDAETRGNWILGYVMAAHLAGDDAHRARAEGLVDGLEATADPDGYLGIYASARRYAHPDGENGELWGQSRALLALAASYEATGRRSRLEAVERAAALTMRAYGEGRPHFRRGTAQGRSAITGLTHGLCWADVASRLAALTGRREHAAFGAWLYRDFSSMPRPFPNDDLALGALLGDDGRWSGHAVHTAEHLRALLLAREVERDPALDRAWSSALAKLDRYTLPSGALVGDESVHDEPSPDAGYEYCTTTELLVSLAAALASTGDARLGDRAERLAFNAAQGARLPDGRAIAYLSSDTRHEATAERPDRYSEGAPGRRFKFSPTHDDVACCCNPNAVRLLPSYVAASWLRLTDRHGIALALYGPSRAALEIAGTRVTVEQLTGYPFEDEVRIRVRAARPLAFALMLRVPGWASRMEIAAPGAATDVIVPGGAAAWHTIERRWRDGDEVRLTFDLAPKPEPYASGERAVLRGALQYVRPVAHVVRAIRDYPVAGFHDLELRPRDPGAIGMRVPLEAVLAQGRVERLRAADAADPWASSPVALVSGATRLVPMGCAPLRVAAFPH